VPSGQSRMMKITLIANFPLPYRVPLINEVARQIGGGFEAIYTDTLVPGHDWVIDNIHHKFTFLRGSGIASRSITTALKIVKYLKRTNPDTLVIYGATLPMLAAFVYAMMHKKNRVYFTDSWEYSYSKLSPFRKLIRGLIFRGFNRYIVIGSNGRQHLINHGVSPKDIHVVRIPLSPCDHAEEGEKKFDFIFAGRLISTKMPHFFLDVVEQLNQYLPIRAVVAGAGPLDQEIKDRVNRTGLPVDLPGYLDREELFKLYRSSKILLFPTENDVWGMSAQEALNCGLPVLSTSFCGITNDLLIHDTNGYILPPDSKLWADKIKHLLTDDNLYDSFSQKARASQSGINLISESEKFLKAITGDDL
jgi:glycosyltransferase involved in cell wall biosynthesis